MNWNYCKSNGIKGIECINKDTNKYVLRLNPVKLKETKDIESPTLKYLQIYVNHEPTLLNLKKILISLQREYDSSTAINTFIVNGIPAWFDKATRVGLVNSINFKKLNGESAIKLWLGTKNITIDIDKALKLFAAIEDYAFKCYNVTKVHLKEIEELATIEDALRYDITKDYPNPINLTI
jgi:hypothetical protein